MKKLFLSLMSLCALGANADEGMWTLYNLPTAIYQQMQQEGFQLPMEQLYQSDNAIKNNVINFSGYCSGVVVSPNGLVFTNHHCGFDAIRRHSTVEHDYMLNGFVAQSYEEELPNEDLFVSFMIEQKDVTDKIVPQLKGLSMEKQSELVDSLENAIRLSGWYIGLNLRILARTGKPVVLEEYGYPRDNYEIRPGTPVTARRRYYDFVRSWVGEGKLAGANSWGWGGEAVPVADRWQRWAPYTADPAQEEQGLYSVFAVDEMGQNCSR